MGGFALFESLFRSDSSDIRAATCHLIATIVQNNPYSQQVALQSGLLTSLLSILEHDSSDEVRVKALYAVSCANVCRYLTVFMVCIYLNLLEIVFSCFRSGLVREDEAAQEAFLKADGLNILMRILQSDVTLVKLHVKAAFLVSNLTKSNANTAGLMVPRILFYTN